MFRPCLPADTPVLLALAEATAVFKPQEIVALREVLDDYHETMAQWGHRCFVCEEQGEILGFVYHAPAAMTDRTWYLYWIAVSKQRQARGLGGKLLRFVEDDIREKNGRLLLIETSSTPPYELTRRFYVKHGYEKTAVIEDYYADGDSMVIFRKRLTD